MNKKSLALLLTIAIMVSLFIGCSKEEKQDESAASDGTTKVETKVETKEGKDAVVTEEKITIHYADWVAEGDTTLIENFYKGVAEFNKIYPNIEVILDTQATNKADDFENKYNLLLLSGDKTDIISNKSMATYVARAKQGLYAPIDDYMTASSTSMEDYTVNTTLENGVTYGLPMNTDANIVLLNKDALDEVGLGLPGIDWTWDDFAEYAKKLTTVKDGKKRFGSVMPYWGDPVFYYIAAAQSADDNFLYKDESTHNFDNPVLKDWLEFKYQMTNVDKTDISFMDYTAGNLNYQSEFFNGNAAMLVTGLWSLGAISNTENFPHEFETAMAILPRWKDVSEPGAQRDGSGVMAINSNIDDAHKEAAYKFIEFQSSKGLLFLGKIPSYKDIDTSEIISKIKGETPELVNEESLIAYFEADKVSKIPQLNPDSQKELLNILKEEADVYMSEGQTLDEAIANMIKRADAILEQ
jgi:multiple sugar transport system substrate-binding protein